MSAPAPRRRAAGAGVCPACGATFDCGADREDCWCAAIAVAAPVLAGLRRRYRSCLCPACLGRAASPAGDGESDSDHAAGG